MAETSEDKPSAVKCGHPDAVGKRWGDPISAERQAELQAILDAWDAESNHDERKGAFDSAGLSDGEQQLRKLSGSDIYWLAERVRSGERALTNLHLVGADLPTAHLETLYFNPLYASTMLQEHLMTGDGLPTTGEFRLGGAWLGTPPPITETHDPISARSVATAV
jgi:hypothetical protein